MRTSTSNQAALAGVYHQNAPVGAMPGSLATFEKTATAARLYPTLGVPRANTVANPNAGSHNESAHIYGQVHR